MLSTWTLASAGNACGGCAVWSSSTTFIAGPPTSLERSQKFASNRSRSQMPASLGSKQSLLEHLPEIESALRVAPQILLFLDFDGTLAPIVEDPRLANMPAETREA